MSNFTFTCIMLPIISTIIVLVILLISSHAFGRILEIVGNIYYQWLQGK